MKTSNYNWKNWPTHEGQQFIFHCGEMWVGHVAATKLQNDIKLSIWRGSAVYTIYDSQYKDNFWFRQIEWPELPEGGV